MGRQNKTRKIYGGGGHKTIEDVATISTAVLKKVHKQPFAMSNIEVIHFLIDILSRRGIKILFQRHKNTINDINMQKLYDLNKTLVDDKPFRMLVTDFLRWCLMDYNFELVNTILTVLIEAISFKHFFISERPNKNNNESKKYPHSIFVIMYFLCGKIKDLSNASELQNVELFNFLRFILKMLVDHQGTVEEGFLSDPLMGQLETNKETVICILKYCVDNNTLNGTKTKILLNKFMDQLSLHWLDALNNNVLLSLDILTKCGHHAIKKKVRKKIALLKNVASKSISVLKTARDNYLSVME